MITGAIINTGNIVADAIDGTKIADDAVNTEHIADDAVENAQIYRNLLAVVEKLAWVNYKSLSWILQRDCG